LVLPCASSSRPAIVTPSTSSIRITLSLLPPDGISVA
jgi:hypothetical protein